MAANTYTTYGIADGPSEAGLVRVIMEGEALAQPSEEEVSETIPAERFEHGRASLVAEPYPGTMQVWRGSEAEANLLGESEWTVGGATLTVWELASDPVALVEWETPLSRELTDADFHGGRAALMGEPSSVTLTEDGEPVPHELEGSVLVVEGMGGGDGLVRATYSHAVELTLPAGTSTLPDAPETVTVTGRTLGETPSEEEVTGWALDGSVLVIPGGWDEYVVTYSAQVEEGWSLSEQVREEPAPDSEEGEEGTLEPTSELVGHVLRWVPEGLSITLDGEPTTDWTLDGRTVTVGASGASRTLSLECAMPQSIEVPSSALRASYELPTLPSGEVSVTVGGEALECTVEDRTITVPSLWPEVAQYVVRYSAMVPQGSVEMPCAPVVQDGESVVVTVVNGSPMVTAVMGSGDAQQGQLDDAATIAVEASEAADSAAQVAEEAAEIASATGQHVWEDTDGLHVTLLERDTFEVTPAEANILMNAYGILLRSGLINYTQMSQSGFSIYDGQGNAADNVVGAFTGDGVTLGRAAESHAEIDYHSLQLIDKEGDTYLHISDLRDQTGVATITETFIAGGVPVLPVFAVSLELLALVGATVNGESASASVNGNNVAVPSAQSGDVVAITYTTTDQRAKAYTLGVRGTGTVGPMSVAEGDGTKALAYASHAEGRDTVAGYDTAHAEGDSTEARGPASHAQNVGTTANGTGQTALGRYNVGDTTSAVILGNGTDNSNRSNALTVDWSGNVNAAGGATLSDSATVTRDTSGDTGFIATRSDTGASVGAIVGTGGTNHGLYSFSDSRWIIYSNGTDIRTGAPLAEASGGTGTTYGLQWQSLGSFTGTNNIPYSLTDYSEVMYSAKANGKLVTATVAKQLLTSSAQELWLGGGKSATNVANGGNLRAVINVSLTGCRGVNFSEGSTDRTSSTTWNVYAR